MKSNILFCISIIIIVLGFFSCEEEVDLNGGLDLKPKLVLYGRLCPQLDTIHISLTNSVPKFGKYRQESMKVVDNAVVELSTDKEYWTKLTFDSYSGTYKIMQSEFSIEEGKTYHIRASATGFETVYSSCIIPYQRNLNPSSTLVGVSIEEPVTTPFPDLSKDTSTNFVIAYTIHINDHAGEKNYYCILASSNVFLSDEGKDGQLLNANFTYSHPFKDISEIHRLFPDGIYYSGAVILQIDRNLYLSEYANKWGNMPLMSEPARPYSNIEHGFGVFGAFTITTFTYNFPIEIPEISE